MHVVKDMKISQRKIIQTFKSMKIRNRSENEDCAQNARLVQKYKLINYFTLLQQTTGHFVRVSIVTVFLGYVASQRRL